ncbi:MAG: hypothetical protein NTX27_03595 [Verrucomicrobia bacterium]|nr:hypothetical protein [Verrucomicrobiota bacterium]
MKSVFSTSIARSAATLLARLGISVISLAPGPEAGRWAMMIIVGNRVASASVRRGWVL